MALNDEQAPAKIREYIQTMTDIEVYEYVTRGAVGEVYFGHRKKLKDDVVLKFYDGKEHYDSSEEAVILKKIDHPNILKVIDLKFVPPYYALFTSPKIDGGDLQGILDNGPISTSYALNMMAGTLLGCNELHSKHQLVHRDLKPGNILVDLSATKPIVADLGAVKKVADPHKPVTATKATWIYLPPESIASNEYYFQSDIYQLGIVMFQLLGGHFPLYNQNGWLNIPEQRILAKIRNSIERDNKFNEIISDKILRGKLLQLDTLPAHLDVSFKRVLNKALNPDYTKRFQSAAEFLKAVHDLQRDHPEYLSQPGYLSVIHKDGKEFKLFKSSKTNYSLEQKSAIGWRKNNKHSGSFESALSIARGY